MPRSRARTCGVECVASVATIHAIGEGRAVPENVEAEAALIGALLIENRLIQELRGKIDATDFYEPLHARIFAETVRLAEGGKPVTGVMLKPALADDEALAAVGGFVYISRLVADGAGLLAPFEIAAQIRDMARRRRLVEAARAITEAALTTDEAFDLGDISGLLRGDDLHRAATFELLDLAQLEHMPTPRWLVHETIAADGLSMIYGAPGSGKSFLALDMALRIALGIDWHGARTRRTGVLYIAGEGAPGIGKRVTGWRMHHGMAALDAPFLLLPAAVQVTDEAELAMLLRTIDEAKRRAGFAIGLTIVDTVSRAIAGLDENSQEAATMFVRSCDRIRQHSGGALLGVHHSGKDKERGMRGSSVFLGACDASIRVTKDGGLVTLECEKQKDAEQSKPVYFRLETQTWADGDADVPGEEVATLVPVRASRDDGPKISMAMIASAFAMMVDAWPAKPLSNKPQARVSGRYAPSIFAGKIGGDAETWKEHIIAWLENGNLSFEYADRKANLSGLRVIDAIA